MQGTVAGGAEVTVTGSGFLPGTLVFLDGQPVTTQIVNGKNLLLVTPPHDPGLVDVQATAPDGFTAVLEDAYNFILQAPFIAGITPDFGPPDLRSPCRGADAAEGKRERGFEGDHGTGPRRQRAP